MSLIKVLVALDKPKGITFHLYNPSLVLKVVFHSYPSRMWIWWYPLHRSILEKYFAPTRTSNMSSKCGIGKWYLMVILLMALLSMHILHIPSFFGVNNVGTKHWLMLSYTNPFCISSFTYLSSFACCIRLILYATWLGRLSPRIKSI